MNPFTQKIMMAGHQSSGAATYTNSIQQVSVTIPNASTSNTATLPTAVGSGAFLIYQGTATDYSSSNSINVTAYLELTNSTTITATRQGTTNELIVNCVVIDATASLVSSVQTGVISVHAGGAGTATITAVDTSRSAVFYLGQTTTYTGAPLTAVTAVKIELTNSTTVSGSTDGGSSSYTTPVGFCVVEFAPGIINSIQQLSSTQTSGTSNTETISSINTSNSMLAWGGFSRTTSAGAQDWPRISLTNGTTVTITSGASAAYTVNFTVIEFVSGVINTPQLGTITVPTGGSADATISSADPTKTFINYTGMYAQSASTQTRQYMVRISQTDATTVNGSLDYTSSYNPVVGFSAITFNQ